MSEQNIIVTGGLEIPGFQITKICGMVRGLVVRSPTITQGILGGLKSMIDGRVESYRTMCETSRNDAYFRNAGACAINGRQCYYCGAL